MDFRRFREPEHVEKHVELLSGASFIPSPP